MSLICEVYRYISFSVVCCLLLLSLFVIVLIRTVCYSLCYPVFFFFGEGVFLFYA